MTKPTWPTPTRSDHERFCIVEGWAPVEDARGRIDTHHVIYELRLPDGRPLRTRISRPPDRTDYASQIWAHILRDQLDVTEAEFWACVQDRVTPKRGIPTHPVVEVPPDIRHLLSTRIGLDHAETSLLTREEAIARINMFWTEGS
jgi:hypothetical protein